MNANDEASERERLRETQNFAAELSGDLASFGILPIDAQLEQQTRTGQLRRLRRRRFDDPVGVMTLLDDDGVLRWRIGNGPAPRRSRLRAGKRRGPAPGGRSVAQYKFVDLPPNLVGKKLRELDDSLTGAQGLFAVHATPAGGVKVATEREVSPPEAGRLLLFVHGTFSNCQHLLAELEGTETGAAFLRRALAAYDAVLAFNHPTLSVSPILNAAKLASCFRQCGASVDVICHSRGGLVTRWWLEALDPRRGAEPARGDVLFAGSPLAGTGLAAPKRLKGALEVLTNLSKALGVAAKAAGTVFPLAAPIGHAAGVLFSLFGKVISIAASTPLLDAGVSMIPGLAAQSREGANGEILRLRESFTSLPPPERTTRFLDRYWFVTSDFETEDPGWKFWRYFRKDKLADVGADMVFEGQNDLVVDSPSMTDMADGLGLAQLPAGHVHDFGSNADVHHCNYFRQAKTIEVIEKSFRV